MLDRPSNEKAPDVAPSEAKPNTVEANDTAHIAQCGQSSNPNWDREKLELSMWAVVAMVPGHVVKTSYTDGDGRAWSYKGKKAIVLDMLMTRPGGITQLNCIPWHTRLSGTIHALRQDGLEIVTEIEGRYRHARYRMPTDCSLIIDPIHWQAAS